MSRERSFRALVPGLVKRVVRPLVLPVPVATQDVFSPENTRVRRLVEWNVVHRRYTGDGPVRWRASSSRSTAKANNSCLTCLRPIPRFPPLSPVESIETGKSAVGMGPATVARVLGPQGQRGRGVSSRGTRGSARGSRSLCVLVESRGQVVDGPIIRSSGPLSHRQRGLPCPGGMRSFLRLRVTPDVRVACHPRRRRRRPPLRYRRDLHRDRQRNPQRDCISTKF